MITRFCLFLEANRLVAIAINEVNKFSFDLCCLGAGLKDFLTIENK